MHDILFWWKMLSWSVAAAIVMWGFTVLCGMYILWDELRRRPKRNRKVS